MLAALLCMKYIIQIKLGTIIGLNCMLFETYFYSVQD